MRRALAILLLLTSAFATDELKRPTAEADGGTVSIGCIGNNRASGTMPNAWDAAGLATSSAQNTAAAKVTAYQTRLFASWTAASTTYTTLTLNVNSKSGGYAAAVGIGGETCVYYSINSGGSWTKIRCDSDVSGAGWTQATNSITLSATQDLTKLKVGVCTQGDGDGILGDGGSDNITVYDIWTDGSYSVTNSGAGNSAGKKHNPVFIF